MRTLATKQTAINQYNGFGNQLWDIAGTRPSLDLQFSDRKDLVDATTGSNLVDFTRASSGTYVGSDGLIKTATTNLLLQSEDFSTTWSQDGVCTVATDQILSPTGTLTADKITVDSGGVNRVSQTAAVQVSAGNTYILSAYVKTLDINKIHIRLFLSGSDSYANYIFADNSFTISNVTIITQTGYTSLSDGWTRIYARYEPTVSGNVNIRFGGGIAGDSTNGSFYLWGAQLEQSSTVGEYVKTTSTINSAPRFDHDPTTGESLGLLVEESRTNLLTYSEEFDDPSWSTSSLTITPNDTNAPNGTLTADRWQNTSTTGVISQSITKAAAATTYTASVWMKSTEAINFSLTVDDGGTTNRGRCTFDITTGEILTENNEGDFTNTSATITAYPDSWYRITVTTTTNTQTTARFRAFFSGSGDTAYIWGAQLEASSVPTSYIPTEGSTVTRAADVASISGSNFGAFRTNLLQYSEEFDQAGWTDAGTFTWTPSTDLAPDGSLTVDKPSVVFTHWAFYDATNLAFLSGYPAAFPFTVTSSWTRQSVTITAPAGCTSLRFYPGRVGGAGNYFFQAVTVTPGTTYTASAYYKLDSASSTVLIWGAQLEEGSTATPYIKSDVNFVSRASSATYYDANGVIQTAAVDEARTAAYLPDGNGNFVSAGPLLLEDAGTNLLLRSEEFSTTWTATSLTFDTNSAVAPDGKTTADKLIETIDPGVHQIAQGTVTTGVTYVFSVYAKAAERDRLRLSGFGVEGQGFLTDYDLSAETVTSAPPGSSITPVGNGWYRCSLVVTANGTAGPIIRLGNENGAFSYTGDGTSGIYLWGAQLEESSYATSYILTTSSTATRAADVSTSAATTVFESDWYRQDEGTVFSNCRLTRQNSVGGTTHYEFSDGTNDERFLVFSRANGGTGFRIIDAVEQVNVSPTNNSIVVNTAIKIAAAVKENDIAVESFDDKGLQTGTGTLPTVDRLNIGNGVGSGTVFLNGTIRRLVYWDQRLPNDTLQTITQ